MNAYRVWVWPRGYAHQDGRISYLISQAENEADARRQVQKLLTGTARIDSVVLVATGSPLMSTQKLDGVNFAVKVTPEAWEAYCREMSAKDNS